MLRSDIVSPITEILIPRVSWLGVDVSNLTAALSFAGEGTRHGQSPSHHGLGTRLLLSTCEPDIQGKQGGLTDLLETIRTWTSRSHGFPYLVICPLLESGEGCTWLNYSQNLPRDWTRLGYLSQKPHKGCLQVQCSCPWSRGGMKWGSGGPALAPGHAFSTCPPLLPGLRVSHESSSSFPTSLPAFNWGVGHKPFLTCKT